MKRVILAAALLAFAGATQAQQFPTRPVTLIVPWPPGGTTDITMRSLATAAEKHLGQSIVIENRGGASGTLGPGWMAANAKPDGYTVAQMPITVFRLPFMQKTTFDPAQDFTYVIGLTGYTFGVVVRDDAPWKTFKEFLADARANPGKINYGVPGVGTSLHVTMEQIAKQQGIHWVPVPFKGGTEPMNALLGGHIHAVADSTGWAPLVNSGKFRLLDISPMKAAAEGIDMVSNSPFGIAGPKGMDPKASKVLHDAFRKGMQDPTYLATIAKFDQEEFYLGTADYHAFAMQQIAEQKRLVEELGLKQE